MWILWVLMSFEVAEKLPCAVLEFVCLALHCASCDAPTEHGRVSTYCAALLDALLVYVNRLTLDWRNRLLGLDFLTVFILYGFDCKSFQFSLSAAVVVNWPVDMLGQRYWHFECLWFVSDRLRGLAFIKSFLFCCIRSFWEKKLK